MIIIKKSMGNASVGWNKQHIRTRWFPQVQHVLKDDMHINQRPKYVNRVTSDYASAHTKLLMY